MSVTRRVAVRLLGVSIGAWLVGLLAYVLVAGPSVGLAPLLIYGALFSAIPALGAFWLVLVPAFSALHRRRAPRYAFPVVAAGLCVVLAALLNSVPATASGAFSEEAFRFYVVFGLVGLALGAGYLWSRRPPPNNALQRTRA